MTCSHLKIRALLLGIAATILAQPSVSAREGDFSIQTGQGEAFQVKHNLLGQRNFAVQDRLGDRLAKKRDIFGNSKTDVSILGNDFQRKKNIFGNKSVKASDMLGDAVETKRSWFGLGRRKTSINLSGSSGLMRNAFAKKRPQPNFDQQANQSPIDSAFPKQEPVPQPVSGIPGVNGGAE